MNEIESIHKDEKEEHRKVWPLEIIQCNYHGVAMQLGCEVKMACKDINTYNKQEVMEGAIHLSLGINELMHTKMNLKHDMEKTL